MTLEFQVLMDDGSYKIREEKRSDTTPLIEKENPDEFEAVSILENVEYIYSTYMDMGIVDPGLNNGLMSGVSSLGGVTIVTVGSHDGIGKGNNGDLSSLSLVLFHVFGSGMRGRKCSGAVEKEVERRMIKNRESAARSRAMKQGYTMEMEAEVAKLKEQNKELEKKQAEIMEMWKN